jgi:hypothetical protein
MLRVRKAHVVYVSTVFSRLSLYDLNAERHASPGIGFDARAVARLAVKREGRRKVE